MLWVTHGVLDEAGQAFVEVADEAGVGRTGSDGKIAGEREAVCAAVLLGEKFTRVPCKEVLELELQVLHTRRRSESRSSRSRQRPRRSRGAHRKGQRAVRVGLVVLVRAMVAARSASQQLGAVGLGEFARVRERRPMHA